MLSKKPVKMVRVNTRISSTLNEWLDDHSAETGMPKSTIVMLALEDYMKQKEVMRNMADMSVIMEKLEQMERKLPNVEQ